MQEECAASLVITTRNRVAELVRSLESAIRQTVPLDIILLDDASSDGTPEIVRREFPSVRLITNEQRQGYIRLRNIGAQLAKRPIIFSIDDDAVFTAPNIAAKTLDAFRSPRVGAVAIPFVDVNITPEMQQQSPDPNEPYATAWYIGTAHALRRDIFLAHGGYNELFVHQHEERDYCARMLSAGYVVRLGYSEPIHHFASPKRETARQDFYTARNNILIHWCNTPSPDIVWRLFRSTAGNLIYGLRNGRTIQFAKGVLAGWHEIIGGQIPRSPLPKETHRMFRRLESSPTRLAEIEHLLPPLAD